MADDRYDLRAPLYDVEYVFTGDRSFLESLLSPRTVSIMEIPCGSGRNVHWLANSNREVTFIDREPAMIREVLAKILEYRAQDRMTALVGDMRTLATDRTHDLILVPQDSFLLIRKDEAVDVLRTLRDHLAPHGRLALDIALLGSDPKDRDTLPAFYAPEIQDGQIVHEWRRPIDASRYLMRKRRQFHTANTVRIVFDYQIIEDDREVDSYSSEIELARYDYASIMTLIAEADLSAVDAFRNYAQEAYTVGASRILLALTPRQGG